MSYYMEYTGKICFADRESKEAFIEKAMSGGWMDEADEEKAEYIRETVSKDARRLLGDKILVWGEAENSEIPVLHDEKCVYFFSGTGLQNNIYKLMEYALEHLNVDKTDTRIRGVAMDGGYGLEEYLGGSEMYVLTDEEMEKVLGKENLYPGKFEQAAYAWMLNV